MVVDIQRGINVVLDALKMPIMQIAENAGLMVMKSMNNSQQRKKTIGSMRKTGEWVDMYEAGIIDPTKVTRSALLNAASISGLFITTEAAIAKLPEKEIPVPPAMGQY